MTGVLLREFQKKDIPDKVRWVNDSRNNQYLHYDLPLHVDKTEKWFEKNQGRTDRFDAVIEYQGRAVGVIGLLSIAHGMAEYYVTLGEPECRGMGIAREATNQLLLYAFHQLGLKEVYLYTEVDNIAAQRLFERSGFIQKRIVQKSALNRGKWVDRYYYAVTKEEYEKFAGEK